MSNYNNLEYIKDLLQACFVPELKQDIDTVPIQTEHFNDYRKVVKVQLPLLFDLLQQNEKRIFTSNEQSAIEIEACVIILLCEITATSAPYRLDCEVLQKNANRLLKQRQIISRPVEQYIFTHYQKKLHNDCWKRHLGSIHSFLRFLEIKNKDVSKENIMSRRWLNFCLSVGLTVHECHDPIYKEMAVCIFQFMLNNAKFSDVLEQNIHSVIYKAIFNDVHALGTITTEHVWNCLYKCLDFYNDINSFDWCQIDDMMDILLRNITLASDGLTSIHLLEFVTKFGAYFAINRQEIESICASDFNTSFRLSEFHDTCIKNTSYTIFRWAKSILNMFIMNAYKLMQSSSISHQFLLKLHRCYMVCIMPIDLQVIEPHLLPFYDKFTVALMEVIVVQKNDQSIVQLVKCFLETFILQLQHKSSLSLNSNFPKYREALQQILKHNVFL